MGEFGHGVKVLKRFTLAITEIFAHLALFAALTALTQIGGLAWLAALAFRRRLLAFALTYAALWFAALWIAPTFGREPLPCAGDGPMRVQSPVYCLLNRQYVTPELAAVARDLAQQMNRDFPGTETLVLDAGFPFIEGFPLLPHLSHDDGEKLDLAFYYADRSGYLPGRTRSPIGYFAFETTGSSCPEVWPTLRWDIGWLQPLWRALELEPARTRAAIDFLVTDSRTGKVFLEPELQTALGLSHAKLRFQGCRAARHDDHIHVQL